MIVQSLMAEFQHEAENTRKLLKTLTDKGLDYRPSPINWTMAELASHIAETYNWYPPTLENDEFKMDDYQYDKGDISHADVIVKKFEENYIKALHSLQNAKDEDMMRPWVMTMGGKELMPPMLKIQVIRGFLMNHLYHHRGELITYMRANGMVVPGLYGPTYEEMKNMQQS